jgi:acetyl-CoA synthetase
MPDYAWVPDQTTVDRAQLTRFLRFTGHSNFESMYRWSVDDVAGFTDSVLRFLDVPFSTPYTQTLDLRRGIEWPQWCIGGRLNIARACLDSHPADRPAVVWEGEEGITRTLTYGDLREKVGACAAGLRMLGVRQGDAVGIHLPMVPETVIALLGCAHAGAVAVPLFSGYGSGAIQTRMRDVGARVLITADGFPRRGLPVASARCAGVQHTVVLPRLGTVERRHGSITWDELLTRDQIEAVDTAAEDPLIAIYTSGTTGKPKGILHTHCRQCGNTHLVDHRHRLDDGAVAHLRSSAARRHYLSVRRRA